MSRYLVGIDLGTTNSALAYVDTQRPNKGGRLDVRPFPVPQLVQAGEIKERALLPSFLYLPSDHDLPAGAIALPWDPKRQFVVGEFARNHGGRIPGRLVNSAKSWLCHSGVDRTAGLLPWSAPPDVPRISPVEASARYLRHLVESWNYAIAKGREDDRLEKQEVVLTVPASFDDVARNLTVEAAKKAGLENIVLLEEPQAAFYCWLVMHSATEAGTLKPGSRCLVIDIGGGTSDFSLIEAVEQQGDLGFMRQAVGDHLLLGGDNMDLALAKYVESKLPGAGKLDAAQYGLLTQACRIAKEVLLSPNAPAHQAVTVVGRGRSVIGGTLTTQLTPDDIKRVIFDGFFPHVPVDADPARGARTGLHEMGLPYVSDPAITKHLVAFLKHQTKAGESAAPAAILFNGGVFQPLSLQKRLVDVLHGWFDKPEQPWQPLVLTNPSLDLAVAWGAAYFGWLRHSGGRRIGGGIARSYYVAVDSSPAPLSPVLRGEGSGVRGALEGSSLSPLTPNPSPLSTGERGAVMTVLCVVPQHLEEGQEIELQKPELELALGQPVMFPLYTSTVRADDKPGDVLHIASEQLLQLPPLHTVLRGGKRSGVKSVPVTLAAKSTAIGTLEVYCVAKDGNNRWRLEFNVRDLVKEMPSKKEAPEEGERTLTEVWLEPQVQEAARLIREVYHPTTQPLNHLTTSPQELTKALEAALDAPRHEWPTGLCRRLWEFLAEVAEERRQSPSHLARWYNLAGYVLRPGFGDPLDKFRIETLWKMMVAPPKSDAVKSARPTAPRLPESGADVWILWRRVSGGLNTALQQALYDRIRPVLLPAKGKAGPKPSPNELAEMWRAGASLERLEVKNKEALGTALLKLLRKSPVPTYAFWALTRLGARSLIYGPLNAVVHPQTAEKWLEAILPFEPGNQSERMAWGFCLSQLAKRTGQRALDLDDASRPRVLSVLRTLEIPKHWIRMVEEVLELEQEEQGQMLGDSLPIGLRLLRPQE